MFRKLAFCQVLQAHKNVKQVKTPSNLKAYKEQHLEEKIDFLQMVQELIIIAVKIIDFHHKVSEANL